MIPRAAEMESPKPRFDISMSRRTRRAQDLNQRSSEERENDDDDGELTVRGENQKSLEQLIGGRCSLAQRFREEEDEQQQVAPPSPAPDAEGDDQRQIRSMKKRSTVRNYGEMLSHMIKVKQESYIRSWRKSAITLKLIKNK